MLGFCVDGILLTLIIIKARFWFKHLIKIGFSIHYYHHFL